METEITEDSTPESATDELIDDDSSSSTGAI